MKKVLFGILVILITTTGCTKQSTNKQDSNSIDNSSTSDSSIKDMSIGYNKIVALSNSGELYTIGDPGLSSLGLGEDMETASKPTKVAENVEMFVDEGTAIYYINTNNALYYTGLKLQGGVEDSFIQLKTKVQSVASYYGFCVITTDLNNNSYGVVGKFTNDACALPFDKYSEFTQITTDVKQVFAFFNGNGYINNNNELFIIKDKETSYTKIMDNVKQIANVGFSIHILTEDNSLYLLDFTTPIKKIADNVVDMSDNGLYFETKDDYLYFVKQGQNNLVISNEIDGYERLNFDNVEKIFYVSYGKYVYLNKEHKIEMHTEYDKYILDNDISSMEQILKFISN